MIKAIKTRFLGARFHFIKQDCWVGVYWRDEPVRPVRHIYICLVPCFPLCIAWVIE